MNSNLKNPLKSKKLIKTSKLKNYKVYKNHYASDLPMLTLSPSYLLTNYAGVSAIVTHDILFDKIPYLPPIPYYLRNIKTTPILSI